MREMGKGEEEGREREQENKGKGRALVHLRHGLLQCLRGAAGQSGLHAGPVKSVRASRSTRHEVPAGAGGRGAADGHAAAARDDAEPLPAGRAPDAEPRAAAGGADPRARVLPGRRGGAAREGGGGDDAGGGGRPLQDPPGRRGEGGPAAPPEGRHPVDGMEERLHLRRQAARQGHKHHLLQVLRLSLRWARPLLEDEDLDVQIIYMVRDPRAVFSSRARVDWCTSSTCRGIQTVCSLLGKDLAEAAALLQEYPHRFMFVQYEEMCQNMSASLADMMDFLGLPVTDVQKNMLRYESPSTDPHTIAKNSLLQAQLWRNLTSFEDIVVPVQDSCRASLEKLGLRIFSSYTELQNLSVPALIRPPVP
ncbi:carbohydrate sulfotransferase 1 isoform X2 [Penaeus vannamei]|uniref:carbohydrate sulfotransferase 1 isoform X2 n=1 Tax=Penaeus vannamei TaxID=6689 RepID=UPI00387F64F4